MAPVSTTDLRARFASRLSEMYASEVPAYRALVRTCEQINAERTTQATDAAAVRRVSAERHGAIRLGSPLEVQQAGRVFAAFGMHPVGFYDLRHASNGVPVVSTAFRPLSETALAENPFRVFTSVLATADRSWFSSELAARIETFLAGRQLFSPRLLELSDTSEEQDGLSEVDADELVDLATDAFRLSQQPIDRGWYQELSAVSAVAADIAGCHSTHINHLTPRVLDIDELWQRMTDQGVRMIDEIQGPPRTEGPDVLLRQTSFRALPEQRSFTDGTSQLGVRFGEVESRGIALTPPGRALYEHLLSEVEAQCADEPDLDRRACLEDAWDRSFPGTEAALEASGLGVFTYHATTAGPAPHQDVRRLLAEGWLRLEPVTYEDFLPQSAAGIFRSNLDEQAGGHGGRDATLDQPWLEGVLGRTVHSPDELYEAQSHRSLQMLGLPTTRTA